jgi:hypothetical protein
MSPGRNTRIFFIFVRKKVAILLNEDELSIKIITKNIYFLLLFFGQLHRYLPDAAVTNK